MLQFQKTALTEKHRQNEKKLRAAHETDLETYVSEWEKLFLLFNLIFLFYFQVRQTNGNEKNVRTGKERAGHQNWKFGKCTAGGYERSGET